MQTSIVLGERRPQIASSVFVAPTAVLIGDLQIGADSSVWYHCVVRADVNWIRIGDRSNVQDGTVIHVNREPSHPTRIGNDVTIGHNVTLHGCEIGDRVLVGMGAVVLNGARIGSDVIIGAGALVPQGMEVPDGSLVLGNPGRIKRELRSAEYEMLLRSANDYVEYAREHMELV